MTDKPAKPRPKKPTSKKKTLSRVEAVMAARDAMGLDNKGPKQTRKNKGSAQATDQPPIDLKKLDKEADDDKRYRMLSVLRKSWDWSAEWAEMFMYRMGRTHLTLRQIAQIIGYDESKFAENVRKYPLLFAAYEAGKADCLRMTAARMHQNAQAGCPKSGAFLLERLDREQYGKTITVDQKTPVQFIMPQEVYDGI